MKSIPIYRDKIFFTKNKLETFYGFIEVLIEAPTEILPILPFRSEGNLEDFGIIYPTGVYKGTYFSEELHFAV